MLVDHALEKLANEVLDTARRKSVMVATAESCTGGIIAAMLTDIAGSSDVFDCAFVTYSNEAKASMLGVDSALIAEHGAVSEQVARAMAEGVLAHSQAMVSVSVTGIAGPGGGSAEKPVGRVHFASAIRGMKTLHSVKTYDNSGRSGIRLNAAKDALKLVLNALESLSRA